MQKVFAVVAVVAATMMAGTAHAQKPSKPEPLPKKAMCPVMKHDFKPTAKTQKSAYKGKTYYFCCGGCKPTFDKNPEKYATTDKPKPKTEGSSSK
ncbi:MAG: hypothetical protein OHK0029_27860 [Armatimonadaceae bacterium]